MATRKPASESMSDAPVSRRVLVNIKRDQTTATPRVVWQHEFPILEAVFGEGQVVEVDRAALDEGYSAKVNPSLLVHNKRQDAPRRPSESCGLDHVFIGAPQAEYERLALVYGKHPEINQSFVENVYGRFSTGVFAKAVGRPSLADLPAEQLRYLVQAYGYSLPVATFKATEAERSEAAEAARKFDAMGRAELAALAEELGVEIGG